MRFTLSAESCCAQSPAVIRDRVNRHVEVTSQRLVAHQTGLGGVDEHHLHRGVDLDVLGTYSEKLL